MMSKVKYQIRYLRILARRFGYKKVLIWSIPFIGTIMFLNDLEDRGYRYNNLSRYTFNYVSSRIWELQKGMKEMENRIKELEENNTRIY